MSAGSKILVVCIGNICRSPAAEGFIARYFKDNAIQAEVSSAGIHAMVGKGAATFTEKLMYDEYGIDVSQHRARQITEEMVRYHDLIWVMDDEQVDSLKKMYSFASGKIYRIGKWRQVDVSDPYRQSEAVFRSCINLLNDCVSDWMKKI